MTLLRVIAFEGGWNLPIWVGQKQGLFEAQGLRVELGYTPGSAPLMSALHEGKADIAFALFDNVVAYDEGQGEAKLDGNPEFVAFLSCDDGFATVVAAPEVKRFADLEGKTLAVDAMTTGFAFLLRDLIARNGVAESNVTFVRAGGTANRYKELIAGKHAATLLRTPYEVLARERGFTLLTGAGAVGRYQGTVGIARRSWGREHEGALVGFARAYRAAVDRLYDRTHRSQVEAMLATNIGDLTPALARQAYDVLLPEAGGLTRDLAVDPAGMQRVLQLRSAYSVPPRALNDASKYVEPAYLLKAMNAIGSPTVS